MNIEYRRICGYIYIHYIERSFNHLDIACGVRGELPLGTCLP